MTKKTFDVKLRIIASIRPYEGNPRVNDQAVDAVAASQRDEELWAAVPGYEELYEVSSAGRIRRRSKSRMAPAGYVLKQRMSWDGYRKCTLSKRGRSWHTKTHRLVALAFLGPPPFPGAHVAHFDGDRTNNHVSNLRWATAAQNEADKRRHGTVRGAPPGERHPNAKLTGEAVAEMRRDAAAGQSATEIARRFGVPKMTAYSAIVGTTWSSVTEPAPLGRLRRKTR